MQDYEELLTNIQNLKLTCLSAKAAFITSYMVEFALSVKSYFVAYPYWALHVLTLL